MLVGGWVCGWAVKLINNVCRSAIDTLANRRVGKWVEVMVVGLGCGQVRKQSESTELSIERSLSIPECLQSISGSTPMNDQLGKDGGEDVSTFTFRHIHTNQSLISFI